MRKSVVKQADKQAEKKALTTAKQGSKQAKGATKKEAKPTPKSTSRPQSKATPKRARRAAANPMTPASTPQELGVPPQRMQRGRPPRLSQQAVIDKTMELLVNRLPEEITLALLAQELNTATVSIYKYFPNRDAVLDAVAEYFYSLFEFSPPKRDQPWQETALAWMWAVYKHIERHPLAWRMYGVDGQVSTALMKMCAPINHLLERERLEGEDFAFASAWFINHALGLIFNEATAGEFRRPIALRHIVDLPANDQDTYLALRPFISSIDSNQVLEFGFQVMIDGLTKLLAQRRQGRG